MTQKTITISLSLLLLFCISFQTVEAQGDEGPAKYAINGFKNYLTKLQWCVDNDTDQDQNGNSFSRLLSYAEKKLVEIEKRDAGLAPPYRERYEKYAAHIQNALKKTHQ